MATLAAVGKACAQPQISAAMWKQDHFFARKTQFSWSPRLYFFDEQGKTLAFVRNTLLSGTHNIRVFTDPTLSFELLSIKAVSHGDDLRFDVTDPMNHQHVGVIKQLPRARFQRRYWTLTDAGGDEVGGIAEDSLLLAGMRRLFAELLPQSYTFMASDRELGKATHAGIMFSQEMEIDLAGDADKRLDRRLVTAAIVILMAASGDQSDARS